MNCKLLSLLLAVQAAIAVPSALLAQEVKAPEKQAGEPGKLEAGVQPKGGNSWFPVTEQDLGTHYNHDTVVGRFPFKNPGKAPVVWKTLIGSCQCSKAVITVGERRYRFSSKPVANTILRVTQAADGEHEEKVSQIEVGAEESGEVEVHMELGGVAGARQATLDIHTTDEQAPQMKLKWHAVGAQVFVVSPQDVNLNQMVWNEKREFTVTIQSPLQRDFNITGYENADPDFTVTYEKSLNEGTATWTVKGTYAPHSADVVGGGVLKFNTDISGQQAVTVRVSATIQGPLEVKPGTFLTLGMIRRGQVRTERVTFEPNDGTDLDATEIRIEKLTMDPKFVTTRKSKDGTKLVVEIEVSKDAPGGLLRGDLVVELNHPAIKSKKILFNGFVR